MRFKRNASPRDERADGRRVSSARERDFFVASALARVDAFSASASLARERSRKEDAGVSTGSCCDLRNSMIKIQILIPFTNVV